MRHAHCPNCNAEYDPRRHGVHCWLCGRQMVGTAVSRIDRYGRSWRLSEAELCAECGQPDNCGDCTHEPLTAAQVLQLGGQLNTQEQRG